MTSPFAQMASTLAGHRAGATPIAQGPIPKDLPRVERIRRLLKNSGCAMTDAEIAWDMAEHFPNFGTHLVWLLLKYDIAKGRVRMIRHGLYRWNDEFDTAEAAAIRAAEKLLKAHGYKVEAPHHE